MEVGDDMTSSIQAIGAVRIPTPLSSAKPRQSATASGLVDPKPDPPATLTLPDPRGVPQPTRTTRVEVSLSAGIQTVIIYDVNTGQPVYQAPPEQTRQMLDKALAAPRRVDRRLTGH
jgi:hypothetical protein